MNVATYFIRSALWPAIIFVIILMIIGCLGNGLIIFIYRHHFYRSVPWLFIYVLAVLDLLACLIAMPSELTILFTSSSFPSEAWCKISRYLSFTLHGSSCVILMAIALNRYEKVCRPNNQKLTMKKAKRFCIATILFACVSFIPCFFIYGELLIPIRILDNEVTILSADFNVTALNLSNSGNVIMGKFCSLTTVGGSSKLLAMVFYLFQFILYVALVVLVIFFYSRVISKMVSYSNKQRLLLFQLSAGANRADHVRKVSADANRLSVVNDEHTADFSKDFCRNEISDDFEGYEKRTNCNHLKTNLDPVKQMEHDNMKEHISPPIVDDENEKHLLKPAGSENNLRFVSTKDSNDPLETNELLKRRIHSTDNVNTVSVNIPQLNIIPHMDPYEAIFEPLFLHAPKTHRKKSSTVKGSKKGKTKTVSRSKSNVDVSMRMVKPQNRENDQKVVSCRSLEAMTTFQCGNVISDGTLTVTRRTPKGSKNCVIPLTGLSMKSAVSYDALDTTEKELIGLDRSNTTDDTVDDKSNNHVTDQSLEEELKQTGASIPTGVDTKTVSIRFKVSEHQDTNENGVEMRNTQENSSGVRSINSDKILTPAPATRKLDYKRRQSVRPIRAHRTSRMLFWISLAFVLSFLPFWIIVFVRLIIGSNFRSNMTMTEYGVVSIFIRFTLISNAINPLIYGFMNTQFRNRCSDIFRFSTRR